MAENRQKRKTDRPDISKKGTDRKLKDRSAKLIFGDPILCAQFLRDYVDIPMLKDVAPEDIENVTSRYIHLFTEERDSDVVNKLHLKKDEPPFYVVSLIEHKSYVDYNVVMQLLRYIVFIWEDYEKEQNKEHQGISKTKGFRYPPVLPIIYYEGMENWTAAVELKDRIYLSGLLEPYVPNFQCILVQLKNYSNEEIKKRQDELSLFMLVSKLQEAADLVRLTEEVSPAYIKEVTAHSPKHLLELISQIMEAFLSKMNVPEKEVSVFTEQIRERRMGELFSNFKGYDVQATRREAREEGRKEGRKEGQLEGREEAREQGIEKLVKVIKNLTDSKEITVKQLMEQYELSEETARDKVERYW